MAFYTPLILKMYNNLKDAFRLDYVASLSIIKIDFEKL